MRDVSEPTNFGESTKQTSLPCGFQKMNTLIHADFAIQITLTKSPRLNFVSFIWSLNVIWVGSKDQKRLYVKDSRDVDVFLYL